MNAKKVYTLITLTGVALLLVGVAVHINRQLVLIYNYCYKFVNIQFNNLKKDDVDIDLTLKIRNQSDIDLTIKQYQFKIYIDGYYVADVLNNDGFLFAANSVSTLPIKIKFNPQALGNRMKLADALLLVSRFLTARDNMTFRIEGTLTAKHSIITLRNLPFKISMTVKEMMSQDPNALACKV